MITKQYTVSVPDELWVDSWNNNTEKTYTYEGPETLYVVVSTVDDFSIIRWSETAIAEEDINENETVVELDANTLTAQADYLVSFAAEYEYTFENETQANGDVYEGISNPRVQDYFDLLYSIANGFTLDPIYKVTLTVNEEIALERKKYVQKYDDAYDFDADTQTVIDTFMTNMNNYLDSMATVYPWKHVTLDETAIPKIPASLIATFNTLPEIQ